MRFTENRKIAWIVFAVAVIFSLSFSGGGALKTLRETTLEAFTAGEYGDGLSIANDLKERVENAINLANVAKDHDLPAAKIDAVNQAADQLDKAENIANKAAENKTLQRAVEDLYTSLDNASLSNSDRSFVLGEYKEFNSRADSIGRDAYNTRAGDFNQTLKTFPANLIGSLSRVRPLDLFEE